MKEREKEIEIATIEKVKNILISSGVEMEKIASISKEISDYMKIAILNYTNFVLSSYDIEKELRNKFLSEDPNVRINISKTQIDKWNGKHTNKNIEGKKQNKIEDIKSESMDLDNEYSQIIENEKKDKNGKIHENKKRQKGKDKHINKWENNESKNYNNFEYNNGKLKETNYSIFECKDKTELRMEYTKIEKDNDILDYQIYEEQITNGMEKYYILIEYKSNQVKTKYKDKIMRVFYPNKRGYEYFLKKRATQIEYEEIL